MTKRHVSLPADAEAGVRAFIDEVDERLASDEDTCRVVADVLVDLFGDREAYERWQDGGRVSAAERVRLQSYDPCNTTLESEYYAEKDEEQFRDSKHLFAECGDDCRFFKDISFTYGHNIEVGDNVVIHDDVHLDDRGKLTIGDRVSISDDAHVYSHDHDVVDQTEITNYHTIIEDDVRLTYDTMVRAGCKVGENALVGAKSSVTTDIPAHHVAVGSPAKSVKVKPGWEPVAAPLDDSQETDRDERVVERVVPDDLSKFDEFERDLEPPEA